MSKDYVQLPDNRWVLKDRPEAAAAQHEESRLTDTGNAMLLAGLFGDRLRYDHRRRRWLLWQHHRWEPDRDGEIARLVVVSAQKRYTDASNIEDLKERTRVANWSISSESRQKIEACTALARNFKPIADSGDNWDYDIWLLGVPNGIVDLKTGQLRAGRPEDRITMSTGVDFNPEAKCPRWERFLDEVFGDPDLIDWLWRLLGYSITGDTSEQVIVMAHGGGANGKGVYSGTINYILGDYAYTAPFTTFELHQRSGIPNDLAALEFRRFVSSSETNDNTRLNEARVKAISGCDPITARYLHQEYFTFYPHLKLFLFVNHKPKVVDDSFGFWRRVRLIPFTRTFTGSADDRRLSEKLRAEASGILAWMVRGCLEWQKRGLGPIPKSVEAATSEYQQESDPLAEFVAEKCIERPETTIPASELYKAYQQWATAEGMVGREILTSTTFGRRLGERYQKDRRGGKILYQGIGLASTILAPEHESGQLQDSLTLNITGSNVFPIEQSLREKTAKYPPNYPDEHENGHQVSCLAQNYPDALTNQPDGVLTVCLASSNGTGSADSGPLGIPAEDALELWHREGSPLIHLGPGQNCIDLAKWLTMPPHKPEHLQAVRTWLDKARDNRSR